jgi:hypothetical protein
MLLLRKFPFKNINGFAKPVHLVNLVVRCELFPLGCMHVHFCEKGQKKRLHALSFKIISALHEDDHARRRHRRVAGKNICLVHERNDT